MFPALELSALRQASHRDMASKLLDIYRRGAVILIAVRPRPRGGAFHFNWPSRFTETK